MKCKTLRTGLVLTVCALTLSLGGCDLIGRQKTYSSPQEATDALIEAVKSGKTGKLLRVLGTDAKPLVESGDPVQDRNSGVRDWP